MSDVARTSTNQWTLILEDRGETWYGQIRFHDDRPGWVGVVLSDEEVRSLRFAAGPLRFLLGEGRA